METEKPANPRRRRVIGKSPHVGSDAWMGDRVTAGTVYPNSFQVSCGGRKRRQPLQTMMGGSSPSGTRSSVSPEGEAEGAGVTRWRALPDASSEISGGVDVDS